MQPTLLILAAGLGSRFGGFKQLEPVGPHGELLLEYSLSDARRTGFGRIVFVISKKIESDFKGYMTARYGAGAGFVYVVQELDTGLPPGFAVPQGRTKPGDRPCGARREASGPYPIRGHQCRRLLWGRVIPRTRLCAYVHAKRRPGAGDGGFWP